MPTTFFQRMQEYRKRPDAVDFSKIKIKQISGCVNNTWNKRPQKVQLQYVKSTEGDYEVRQYPDAFIKTIDGIIMKFHQTAQTAALFDDASSMFPKTMAILSDKPKRKRIPVTKPVYQSPRKTG